MPDDFPDARLLYRRWDPQPGHPTPVGTLRGLPGLPRTSCSCGWVPTAQIGTMYVNREDASWHTKADCGRFDPPEMIDSIFGPSTPEVLNPPEVQPQTFDDWYAEFGKLVLAYGDAVGMLRDPEPALRALLGHGLKRVTRTSGKS